MEKGYPPLQYHAGPESQKAGKHEEGGGCRSHQVRGQKKEAQGDFHKRGDSFTKGN